jgi:hypothetical protein
MATRTLSGILGIVGLLTTACADQRGSITPTAVPLAIAEGGNWTDPPSPVSRPSSAPIRLRFAVDLTVPAYPACALTPPTAGVITGTGVLTVLIRSTTDSNGGTHVGTTIEGRGTATDATGATWIWSDADLNNELFPSGNASSNTFEQTITEGFHVIGPKGQQIKVKGTFHVTVVNGTTVVEVEKGNHEADEFCESGFVLTPLP